MDALKVVNLKNEKVGELTPDESVFGYPLKRHLIYETERLPLGRTLRHAPDQDARRGLGERPHGVEAEQDRAGTRRLGPKLDLEARRHVVRPPPARLQELDPEGDAPQRAALGAVQQAARQPGAHRGEPRARLAEDQGDAAGPGKARAARQGPVPG